MVDFGLILGTLPNNGLRYFAESPPYIAVRCTRYVERYDNPFRPDDAGLVGESALDPPHPACYGATLIINMDKLSLHTCAALLTVLLLVAGCGGGDEEPRPEVSIDDLNAALDYLDESGREIPSSVYELTNLPALQGMIFPTLPEGQSFAIDQDSLQVIIELDYLPETTDSFPHKDRY